MNDSKLDLSVVVLTYNEELHIARCLDNVCDIAKEVFVIDSFSTDRTLEIASRYPNVTVFQNKWENNYAKQFNWGLRNAPITTDWILRLDADEYLTDELKEELKRVLPTMTRDISGITLKRRLIFLGKWMRRGVYPVKLLRIFRTGKALCEERLMDEHIQLLEGKEIELTNDFVDHNLNNISWFCHKHVNYAIREAVDLLDIKIGITGAATTDAQKQITKQAHAKRRLKHRYANQPLFLRSFMYFVYRYLIKGAFLEGKVGFIFTFLQGWWYRMLVDVKVYEIEKKCGNDPQKIVAYLATEYNVFL